MSINLHVFPAGPIHTNGYLLTDTTRGEAILVDAPGDIWAKVEPVLEKETCTLKELWITHGHWDHTHGGAEVIRKTGAKVRAHVADKVLIESPQVMSAFLGGRVQLEPITPDFWVAQGDHFTALGLDVEVRHVPGHCPGNVLFYLTEAKGAFVGDALFAGNIGRTDLPGGNRDQLTQSIRAQIYTLPPETAIYPGHGPATTVAQEKQNNPYVRG